MNTPTSEIKGVRPLKACLNEKGDLCVRADRRISSGEILCEFRALRRAPGPTRFTFCIKVDNHVEIDPPVLRYINHSCAPNIFFNTKEMKILALKSIDLGEEICWFYPSLEWQLAAPFICHCGHAKCLGGITGSEKLPDVVLNSYHLSEHIQERMRRRSASACLQLEARDQDKSDMHQDLEP